LQNFSETLLPLPSRLPDPRRGSARPGRSPIHPLCTAAQCPAYSRTRRWQARPLQCPRCQRHHRGQGGTYHERPGGQRDWGHSGKRTCKALPATWLPQRQRPLAYWLLAPWLWGLACASRRMAREGGGLSARASAGAGGGGMPPWPTRCPVNATARGQRRPSRTPPASRAKPRRAGSRHWGAAPGGGASSVRPGAAMMTRPGPP
jgi:hypothetical protein